MALIRFFPSYLLAGLLACPAIAVQAGAWSQVGGDAWAQVSAVRLPAYAWTTTSLVLAVCAGSLVLGIACAWLIAAYEFPGRRTFSIALVLPFSVPAYLAAYAFVDTFQATGPIASRIGWTMASGWAWPEVRSFPLACGVLILGLYPYVYLLMLSSLMRESSTLLEAARTLGLNGFRVLTRVAIPLARPALAGGTLLVALEVMNEYGAVDHFALDALSTGIFRAWYGYDSKAAALQMAAALSLIAAAVVVLERLFRGRARREVLRQKPVAHRRFRLHGWKATAALLICSLPPVFGFALPMTILTMHAWGLGAEVASPADYGALAGRSLALAAGCSLFCLVAGMICTWPARRSPGHQAVIGTLGSMGYAIPGSMIAIGAMLVLPTSGGMLPLLIFSYVAKFACISTLSLEAGLSRISPTMELAARTLGDGPWRTFKRVTLPLLVPALLSAWLVIFTDIVKELSIVALLRPLDFEVLSVHIHQLASDERLPAASRPALALVALSLPPLFWLNRGILKERAQ